MEAKPGIALYGMVCGPFTLASHLRGTNIFMDMYDQPEKVKEPINYCEEVVSEYDGFLVEAGCDVIGAVDPLVSQISPVSFEQFLTAPFSALFDKVREKNVPSTLFVCGDATKNIPAMCLTRPDGVAIDENVDIVAAKKITDEHGNMQQDNQKAAIELMAALGNKDFILMGKGDQGQNRTDPGPLHKLQLFEVGDGNFDDGRVRPDEFLHICTCLLGIHIQQ